MLFSYNKTSINYFTKKYKICIKTYIVDKLKYLTD